MNASNRDSATLRRLLAQRLESLHAAGVEQLPRQTAIPLPPPARHAADAKSDRDAEPAASPPAGSTAAAPIGVPNADLPPPPADDSDDARREALRQLDAQCVQGCTKCPELVASRTQTVFGVGPVRPRLCFFGEAPGRDEDLAGEPFVGAAGQLLNKIIQAMTLRREDTYILNVLKCRPPGNRDPEPQEVANCRPYFEQQLRILQPEFICCLGGHAAKTLLETDLSVGKMRGQFFRYGQSRVIVTYHPAYLLRNASAKRKTWEDIQLLMAEMGLER